MSRLKKYSVIIIAPTGTERYKHHDLDTAVIISLAKGMELREIYGQEMEGCTVRVYEESNNGTLKPLWPFL